MNQKLNSNNSGNSLLYFNIEATKNEYLIGKNIMVIRLKIKQTYESENQMVILTGKKMFDDILQKGINKNIKLTKFSQMKKSMKY